MAEDYYKTLGLKRDASQADIQKAYRDLARKYHPDLNPNDKTAKKKFQSVQAAFDVLNDTSKRELYDRYGSSFEQVQQAQAAGGGAGPSWTGNGPRSSEEFDFSQIFGERYGPEASGGFADIFSQFSRAGKKRGKAARGPSKGEDVRHELEVPLLAAVNGDEVSIQLQRGDKYETLAVKIPPGIEDGKTVRLRGQGLPDPGGGPAGDLLLTVHVANDPLFARQGEQLLVKLPVTLAEAALGAKVDCPTPRGVVTMQIPAGTSSGKKLRIKGQGVRSIKGPAGDLLAEIQIVLPATLDDESRALIEKFDRLNPLNPRRAKQ